MTKSNTDPVCWLDVSIWLLCSNELNSDILERIYNCKDTTSLQSLVFKGSSCTPHHISMVFQANFPSFCVITPMGDSLSVHLTQPTCSFSDIIVTLELYIYSALDKNSWHKFSAICCRIIFLEKLLPIQSYEGSLNWMNRTNWSHINQGSFI